MKIRVYGPVDPKKSETTITCSYGLDDELGTDLEPVVIAADAGEQQVEFFIEDVTPDADYYIDWVAENENGIVELPDYIVINASTGKPVIGLVSAEVIE